MLAPVLMGTEITGAAIVGQDILARTVLDSVVPNSRSINNLPAAPISWQFASVAFPCGRVVLLCDGTCIHYCVLWLTWQSDDACP